MAEEAPGARPSVQVPVWDLGVRVFHWLLLLAIIVAWRTAETRQLDLHRLAGAAAAGLLAFRLIWGFVGGSTARFSSFVKGPGALLAYGRKLIADDRREGPPGHNPIGGWSVVGLIGASVVIILFGLFAVDTDGMESGPLSRFVDFDLGRLAAHLHAFAFDILEALVALHLLAVIFYRFGRREDLVRPMLTGKAQRGSAEGALVPGSLRGAGLAVGGGLAVFAILAFFSF